MIINLKPFWNAPKKYPPRSSRSHIETIIEGPFLPLAEMCSPKFYYHISTLLMWGRKTKADIVGTLTPFPLSLVGNLSTMEKKLVSSSYKPVVTTLVLNVDTYPLSNTGRQSRGCRAGWELFVLTLLRVCTGENCHLLLHFECVNKTNSDWLLRGLYLK